MKLAIFGGDNQEEPEREAEKGELRNKAEARYKPLVPEAADEPDGKSRTHQGSEPEAGIANR